MYSNAPVGQIPHLNDLLSDAICSSRQWQMERNLGMSTTDCLTAIIPPEPDQDISISLTVGYDAGFQVADMFNLVPKWTLLHSHSGR
jgi:hypothetical protein